MGRLDEIHASLIDRGLDHLEGVSMGVIKSMMDDGEINSIEAGMLETKSPEWKALKEYANEYRPKT